MPTQYPVQPERYAERLKRLEKLISLNAPPIIIDGECRLVMGAVHGGYYQAIWYWFKLTFSGNVADILFRAKVRLVMLTQRCTREEACDILLKEEEIYRKNC